MPENNELEKTLWAAADKLRSNMDAAEYKHIVLGLIFLKYISDADIALIADTYHAWRASASSALAGKYKDEAGFCKAATIEEVRNNNYVLMPGRYVGTEEEADDGVPFEEKMNALTAKLAEQFAKGAELEKNIRENLKMIGYEF